MSKSNGALYAQVRSGHLGSCTNKVASTRHRVEDILQAGAYTHKVTHPLRQWTNKQPFAEGIGEVYAIVPHQIVVAAMPIPPQFMQQQLNLL